MKLFTITVGDLQAGSTKFRIVDYLPFLQKNQIEVKIVSQHELDKSHLKEIEKADLVINQKCLLDGRWRKKILKACPKVIFDFDDAIYTRPGKPFSWLTRLRVQHRFKNWLASSKHVITSSDFLKVQAIKYQPQTTVIPMALDMTAWKPAEKSPKQFTIGWAGAPGNLHHLERLDIVLCKVLDRHPEAKLVIFSGKRPQLSCRYEYVPYAPGEEVKFIQRLNVGLLPLSNEEFSRGKSPIKAIQYLACGIPVVGNVYGATTDILNPQNSLAVNTTEEWVNALESLIQQPNLQEQLGKAGRKHAELLFDHRITSTHLLDIIRSVYKSETSGNLETIKGSLR